MEVDMKSIEKIKKLIVDNGIANNFDDAEPLAETLYQLAFTVVQRHLAERSK